MTASAEIVKQLRKAMDHIAAGRVGHVGARVDLARSGDLLELLAALIDSGDRAAARVRLKQLASAVAAARERQNEAGANFSRARRSIQAALLQLTGRGVE